MQCAYASRAVKITAFIDTRPSSQPHQAKQQPVEQSHQPRINIGLHLLFSMRALLVALSGALSSIATSSRAQPKKIDYILQQ